MEKPGFSWSDFFHVALFVVAVSLVCAYFYPEVKEGMEKGKKGESITCAAKGIFKVENGGCKFEPSWKNKMMPGERKQFLSTCNKIAKHLPDVLGVEFSDYRHYRAGKIFFTSEISIKRSDKSKDKTPFIHLGERWEKPEGRESAWKKISEKVSKL